MVLNIGMIQIGMIQIGMIYSKDNKGDEFWFDSNGNSISKPKFVL